MKLIFKICVLFTFLNTLVYAGGINLNLTWDPNSPDDHVIKYNVYKRDGITDTLLGSTTSTDFTVKNLLNRRFYTFLVKAYNGVESDQSNLLTVYVKK